MQAVDCLQVGDFIDNPNNSQKRYRIEQILSNNNGRVYKCAEQLKSTVVDDPHQSELYETIRTVIVKELDEGFESSETNFDILAKCENLHSLHLLLIHENFEKYVGKRKFFIVMEYCGQDLQQVYNHLFEMDKLTMSFILQVLIQNIVGLAALQKVSLLHNDIKPTNMFVLNHCERSGKIEIVTGDYGNLLMGNVGNCDLEIEMELMMGTNGYMAPEVGNEDSSIYSIKSDIWSLGISLLVIISGRHAKYFSSTNIKQQIDETFEKLPNEESWMIIKKIITEMLELDRKKRIDYNGILQHIYSQYPKTNRISDHVHSIEKEYRFLDPAFKTDRTLAMLAVEKYGNNLQHVHEKFKNDVEIVTKAVKQSGDALKYASKLCRLNKDIVIQAISNNGMSIKHTCFSLKDDMEIAQIALKNNIHSQEFVTPRIKESAEWKSIVSERNRELRETSIIQKQQGTPHEERDLDLMRSIVENPRLLSQQPLHKRNDFEFVKELVSLNGNCLEYAYDSLRDDEEIVQIAVSNSGSALKFASDRLRDNLTVVETASILFPQSSMRYASRNIQENEELILKVAKRNAKALYYCPKQVFHYLNSDFISKLLSCNGESLEFCHYVTKKDKSMVILAASQNGMAVRFAHHTLRDNFDIMLAAVTNNGASLEYGSETIRSNPKIIIAALNQNLDSLPYVHETVLRNENGIIKKWVSQNSSRKLKVFFSKDQQMWKTKQTIGDNKQDETQYSIFVTTLHELIGELAKINDMIRIVFAQCQGNAAQLAVLLLSLERDISIRDKSKIYHILAIIFGGIHGDVMVDLFEYDIAFKYLQKAAECGNYYCKLHLIYYYLYGTGTECNLEIAMKLLDELESELGRKSDKTLSDRERTILSSAQYMLSQLLLHSFDQDLLENEYQTNLRLKIPQNIPRGIELLRKSSNNGHFLASIFLGECFRFGKFKLEKDFIASNKYYDLAMKQGYSDQLLSSGLNVQKSFSGLEVEGLVMLWNLKEELNNNVDESDIEQYKNNEEKLARVYAALGKFDESIELFIKVAEKSSIHFMVHFKIGELYFKKSFMYLAKNDLNSFLQSITLGIPYIFKALSATLIDELGCCSFDSRPIIQKTKKHILDRLDATMKIIFSSKFISLLGNDNIETLETFLDVLEKCAFEEQHYEAYYYLGVSVIRKYRYSSKCLTDFFYKASMLGKEFSMTKIDDIEKYFSTFPIESLISRLLQTKLF